MGRAGFRAKPINVDLYKKRKKELSAADETGTAETLLSRVGAVTSQFEACESTFSQLFASLTSDHDLMRLLFNHINNRATRIQMLEEYLEAIKPTRASKRHAFAIESLRRYKFLGARRDEVAHSTLVEWNFHGKKMLLLEPAWHIDRKRVAGLPKYHYDVPSLEKLILDIRQLYNDMNVYMFKVYQKNTERLVKRQERSDARSRAKTVPQSQR